jgi:hypothetical protein
MQAKQRSQGNIEHHGWWKRLDPALRWALGIYLIARVLASGWAALAASLAPIHVPYVGHPVYEMIHQAYPHSSRLLDLLLGVWYRWDTGWFTKVALQGYSLHDGSVTVSPLYPLLIRGLGELLGGEYLLAALVISNVALIVALVLLYKLVVLDFSECVARRCVVYQVAIPAGFFLLAGYTESLYLCMALLSVYAARKSNWVLAGVAAFLTSLTRMQGWVLVFPLAYEALYQAGMHPLRAWPGLLAAAGGPIGTLSYNLYLALAGLPGMGVTYQNAWKVHYTAPWTSVAMAINGLIAGQASFQDLMNTFVVFFSFFLIVISVRKLRPTYWLYSVVSQLIFLMGYLEGEHLHSIMRYTVALFPNVMALALVTRRRWVSGVVTLLLVLLQVVLLGMFIRWIWVA